MAKKGNLHPSIDIPNDNPAVLSSNSHKVLSLVGNDKTFYAILYKILIIDYNKEFRQIHRISYAFLLRLHIVINKFEAY